MPVITKQEMINAQLDAVTFQTVVNGSDTPGTLTSRLGTTLKTIAKIIKDLSEIDVGESAAALINVRIDDLNTVINTDLTELQTSQNDQNVLIAALLNAVATPITLPADFDNVLDIAFSRLGNIAVLDQDPYDLITFTPTNEYHVDYALGSDSNNGLTANTAWKTLDYAFTHIATPCTLTVHDDYVGFLSSNTSSKIVNGNLLLIGAPKTKAKTTIIGMREDWTKAGFAWAASGGSGAYVCTNARALRFYAQFDPRTLDVNGFPTPLTKAADAATCQSTAGTFFWTSGSLYVHLVDGAEPNPFVNWLYCQSPYDFEINQASSSGIIKVENFEFCSNLGPSEKANFRYRPVSETVIDTAKLAIKNCLSYGGSGQGFQIYDVSLTVIKNCKTRYTRSDGFNYHSFKSFPAAGGYMRIYEIDCKSFNVGYDGFDDQPALGTSNNGTSAHDRIHIVRVNPYAKDCVGACIADVSGSISVNLFPTAINSIAPGSPATLYWTDGAFGILPYGMWLLGFSTVIDGSEDVLHNTADGRMYIDSPRGELFEADTVGSILTWAGAAYTAWD